MTVSVVIVNFNGGILLDRCLSHLARQTVKADRVFVVDNASTDGSIDTLESRFPELILMRMNANLGFAAGNNVAISKADTDWVVLLNPDAFAEPDWLERLLAAAEANPEVAAFGCRQMQHGNPELLDGIGDGYLISGQVYRRGYGRKMAAPDLVSREVFAPCAAAAMYRRDVLIECGGFDEDYFCYVEDVDLGFRLRLNGHRTVYVPDAVVHHVGSATTGGQHSDFATYHGHRNLLWTFVKNVPGLLFWILLPLHLLLTLSSIVWFCMSGRGPVILRAKRDAVRGLPAMWKKRRQLQRGRRAGIAAIWRQMDKRITPPRLP